MALASKISGLVAGLIFFVGIAVSVRSATTLAVWGAPDQRDATASLIAELSKRPDAYVVLDREQIERAVGEQALQSGTLSLENIFQAGRLLGADGILWMEGAQGHGHPYTVTRMCAIKSGVVVGWQVDETPLPDLVGWAKLMVARIDGWQTKLGIARDHAVPISLVDLRGVTGALGSVEAGQTLKILLGARLTAQPELFVLERWRLDEVAWENLLNGTTSSGFWNGAWLLDGSITEVAGEVELNMRLRAADGREMRWSRRGGDPSVLVGEIATDVMDRIDVKSPAVSWDRKNESREFLAEAEWASRWNLDARALESVEAAIALGEDSVSAQRLRYNVCSRLAISAPGNEVASRGMVNGWERSSRSYVMPELVRIERSLRAISLYNDFRRTSAGAELSKTLQRKNYTIADSPGHLPPYPLPRAISPAEEDATKLLGNTACILWTAYYATRGGNAEIDAALIRLRAEARALFEREFTALALDFQPQPPDRLPAVDWGGRNYPVQLDSLPLMGFVHGALWAERCRDHELLVRKILGNLITGEEGICYSAITTLSSMRWESWGVDWQSHDTRFAHENWERFVQGLLKEDQLGLQVAGAIWLMSLRDWPVPGDEPVFEKKVAMAWAVLARHLDQLADGRLPFMYYIDALNRSNGRLPVSTSDDLADRLAEQFERPGTVAGSVALLVTRVPLQPNQKERLRALVEQKTTTEGPGGLWADSERDAVMKCFRYLGVTLPESIAEADALPKPIQASVRQSSVAVQTAWLVHDPEAATRQWPALSPHRGIRWAALVDDQICLITSLLENYQKPPVYTLGVVDLPGLQSREIFSWRAQTFKDMELEYDFPSFALLEGWVYSWEERGLCRHRIVDGREEMIALPITQRPKFWAINGWLYLGLAKGGVLRVDPKTNAWELLADSHRRPAQGPLDDCTAYSAGRIWQDAGRLCFTKDGDSEIYGFDEGTRTWSVLSTGSSISMGIHNREERKMALESLNHVEFAALGQGRSTIDTLWRDMGRDGHALSFDAGTYFGGDIPVIKPGARRVRWESIGGMAEGNDLWVLFHHGMEPKRMPHLVWMPESPAETVSIELMLPARAWDELMLDVRQARDPRNGFFGERALMIPSRHGLAIYAVGSPVMWFVSQKELEAAGVSRTAAP
ncbi:MAG: hypothetical protein WC205_11515 [Opitutaceae bacterium]|jgi:hypothetical protein